MKRKWKWLILLCLPVVLFVVWLWTALSKQVPVNVIGHLPTEDIVDVTAFAKREMRRKILPDFSWESFKGMPRAFRLYSSMKLVTIVRNGGNDESVTIFVWRDTNGLSRLMLSNEWHDPAAFLSPPQWHLFSNSSVFFARKGPSGWTNWFPWL